LSLLWSLVATGAADVMIRSSLLSSRVADVKATRRYHVA
jgi:hypothetical protein